VVFFVSLRASESEIFADKSDLNVVRLGCNACFDARVFAYALQNADPSDLKAVANLMSEYVGWEESSESEIDHAMMVLVELSCSTLLIKLGTACSRSSPPIHVRLLRACGAARVCR